MRRALQLPVLIPLVNPPVQHDVVALHITVVVSTIAPQSPLYLKQHIAAFTNTGDGGSGQAPSLFVKAVSMVGQRKRGLLKEL